jgi:hypothetical protein
MLAALKRSFLVLLLLAFGFALASGTHCVQPAATTAMLEKSHCALARTDDHRLPKDSSHDNACCLICESRGVDQALASWTFVPPIPVAILSIEASRLVNAIDPTVRQAAPANGARAPPVLV